MQRAAVLVAIMLGPACVAGASADAQQFTVCCPMAGKTVGPKGFKCRPLCCRRCAETGASGACLRWTLSQGRCDAPSAKRAG